MGRATFDPQFDHLGAMQMEVNGLHCVFNMPHALTARYDGKGNEIDQGLPPYAPRLTFNVDEFGKACPASWMRGDAKSASHFVPVKPEHGLWLDFNANREHTHHVAVRISIQGVCVVTGLSTKDRFHLEQYRERCPKHNVPFGAERFCKEKECNFKWPDQNYLATTGTREGLFWLDGFRAKDGCTRQFVFTEEEMRGVAAQIIGAERVFAIGVAFYLSKEPKPRPVVKPVWRRSAAIHPLGGDEFLCLGGEHKKGLLGYSGEVSSARGAGAIDSPWDAVEPAGGASLSDDMLIEESLDAPAPAEESAGFFVDEMASEEVEMDLESSSPDASHDENLVPLALSAPRPRPKHLEIAAGARIDQPIFRDPSDLSFWQEEPAGIIYINYCDEETARAILSQGKEDRTAHGEGFMDGLRVGNPAPSA